MRRKWRNRVTKLKLLLGLLLLAVPGFAQSTSATISGTVLYSSEARIPRRSDLDQKFEYGYRTDERHE